LSYTPSGNRRRRRSAPFQSIEKRPRFARAKQSADGGAAIDDEGLPGHEAARRRGEKHCGPPAIFIGPPPIRNRGRAGAVEAFKAFSGSSHSALAKSVLTSPGAMQFTRDVYACPYFARQIGRASCMSAAFEMP